MIKNCYFKCIKCNKIKCIYMNDEFVYNITKYQRCDFDNEELIYVEDYVPEHDELNVQTQITDDRKLRKYKYKDSVYQDKVDSINRTYLKGIK